MRIIVIGAGIGGLAAALTLGRSGFEVQLFEQASVLREIGAGVQINPNATRIRDWRTITCPSAQRWMTTAARSHSETAQRLLKSESTGADHAIAGFPNSGFRKFLLRRLQLLKTRNVRSGFGEPAQERRQTSTNAVDVEGRYLHGLPISP